MPLVSYRRRLSISKETRSFDPRYPKYPKRQRKVDEVNDVRDKEEIKSSGNLLSRECDSMTKSRDSRNGSFDIEIIEFILFPVTPECAFLSSSTVFNGATSRNDLFSKNLRCPVIFNFFLYIII